MLLVLLKRLSNIPRENTLAHIRIHVLFLMCHCEWQLWWVSFYTCAEGIAFHTSESSTIDGFVAVSHNSRTKAEKQNVFWFWDPESFYTCAEGIALHTSSTKDGFVAVSHNSRTEAEKQSVFGFWDPELEKHGEWLCFGSLRC